MKQIPIFKGGAVAAVALVDDEDFDRVSCKRWYLWIADHTTYSVPYCHVKGPKRTTVKMHRLILNLPPDLSRTNPVDHIDGNPLNNQKSNLRVVPTFANTMNRSKNVKPCASRFKGVSLVKWKTGTKWRAYIVRHDKQIHLGVFENSLDAAKAYNEAAVRLFGEYARLNLI